MFQRVMGADFHRLHPELRRRFGIGLQNRRACVGTGTMSRIWHAPGFTRPFLWLGSRRHILVPATGVNVPFEIENYPYRDSFGREAVSFVRTFALPQGERRFDATMVRHPDRDVILDYLGTHQHLAVDLRFTAEDTGSLRITSETQVFLEGPVRLPVPRIITGTATVRESFDDEALVFRVQVEVVNRWFGPLFGYEGSFTARYVDVDAEGVPDTVKPHREEARC
ncbi:DUF4166 domain-containing protein [Stackebrandtia albiflava]